MGDKCLGVGPWGKRRCFFPGPPLGKKAWRAFLLSSLHIHLPERMKEAESVDYFGVFSPVPLIPYKELEPKMNIDYTIKFFLKHLFLNTGGMN